MNISECGIYPLNLGVLPMSAESPFAKILPFREISLQDVISADWHQHMPLRIAPAQSEEVLTHYDSEVSPVIVSDDSSTGFHGKVSTQALRLCSNPSPASRPIKPKQVNGKVTAIGSARSRSRWT